MAQATSPDYDQSLEDPSLIGEDAAQGKKSLFGKLKNKTKDKTNKLKTKLKPSSKTNEDGTEYPSSSSDDEAETPVNNAMAGVTQPDYAKQSADEQPDNENKGSASVPASNFPGSFAGIAGEPTEANEDDSDLSNAFRGLSTKDNDESTKTEPGTAELDSSKPVTQTMKDNLVSAKDQTKEKLSPSSGDSEQSFLSPDSPPATEQAQQVGDEATEAGKSWSQWAAEKVGYAKDTTSEKVGAVKDSAAANAPTTTEGKPVHEEAYGAAIGAKDIATEKGSAAKDTLAAQIPNRSEIPSDPAQQTYVQKATGGIYGAKDKLFTSTQPGEHDKALSQKVTETVGNLPATLKSSLGFGAKTGGSSSPTTTPASSDATAEDSTAAGPGIVSRITSLFGTKKPATDGSTATDQSASSEPVISETGSETQTPVSESTDMS